MDQFKFQMEGRENYLQRIQQHLRQMYSLVIVSSEKSYFTIASLFTHSLNSCDRLSRHNVPNDRIPIRTSPFAKKYSRNWVKDFRV